MNLRLRLCIAWCVALAFGGAATLAHAAQPSGVLDVTQRPFEELLSTDIITASKLARQVSGAASAVSIVTAQDIRTYGYRSLDDILDSMRGLHMSHDYLYGYLSGRGYSDSLDYAGRIMLLIDGYSAAENYYGQSFFGEDGFLDVELIERVEFIPGPGSSDYGSGAFLGVINVITKNADDFNGTQVALDAGSHGLFKRRATWGKTYETGAKLLLSASNYRSDGYALGNEASDATPGHAGEQTNQRLFIKGSYDGWTLTSALAQRQMNTPSAPGSVTGDDSTFFSLRYDTDVSPDLKLSTHAYSGQYLFRYLFPWGTQFSTGQWSGLDTKLVGTTSNGHTWVLGAEFRDDPVQNAGSTVMDFSESYSAKRQTASLYAYDEFTLMPRLQLNLGLRLDARDNATQTTSPRAALIYTPQQDRVFKLSTGLAHMQPYAATETLGIPYQIERVHTTELVWEERLGPASRLTSSVYSYDMEQRMVYGIDDSRAFTQGAEIELEHHWSDTTELRASYARQEARDQDGRWPVNSPKHNIKLHVSTPLDGTPLRLGAQWHYVSERRGYDDAIAPEVSVVNLTLSSQNWRPHWHFKLSLRNVFDANYYDISYSAFDNKNYTFPRDRRNLWLQITRDFK